MSTDVTARDRKQRMAWVDIIKATSVVLVVLLHVTQTLDFAADGTMISGFWNGVMTFLEPLRMPVFFVVSGILASGAVQRPWSWTKSRTVGIVYLYLLWHTLLFVFSVLLDLITKGSVDGGIAGAFHDYFIQIFITPGGYWYFYALVLYFVIARLLRNVNPYLVLGVAAALNLARPLVTDTVNAILEPLGVSHMMPSVVLNAVYFLAGVYLVQFFRNYAQRNDSRMLVGTATLAVLGSIARLISPEVAAASFLPIAVAWVLTAILVAVRLQDNERVAAFGAYVGPRTLPIFVVQFFVTDLLYTLFGTTGGAILESSPLLQLIYPIAMTLAITLAALWAYDRAMAQPFTSLLFQAPKHWTARPTPIVGSPTSQAPQVGTAAGESPGAKSSGPTTSGPTTSGPTTPGAETPRPTPSGPTTSAGATSGCPTLASELLSRSGTAGAPAARAPRTAALRRGPAHRRCRPQSPPQRELTEDRNRIARGTNQG